MNKRINLTVPKKLDEVITRYAKQTGMSKPEAIRHILFKCFYKYFNTDI